MPELQRPSVFAIEIPAAMLQWPQDMAAAYLISLSKWVPGCVVSPGTSKISPYIKSLVQPGWIQRISNLRNNDILLFSGALHDNGALDAGRQRQPYEIPSNNVTVSLRQTGTKRN